ncbi:Major facilitator superfamily domain, general substrate transporter [Penicillium expansum]|uniref:Major facilitator superfamily domain, general substrate transporter n=1 Tax=Penicillium expansum TaxID=27334 RepID=A0A0A2IIW7_PENEN|nr:Major facilitator superfamily domain, general substrate transporter [Penicillium expansum]KGO40160.1 Major facilitator superfamily domain, general substrate transporter [Penicillium expansum]KGO40893.1 Major facilitator superfamily domain, general substrate transporter [Penicillium expansum]KGO53076.1 Major facilitator superfamily domain, general substrate transporter [Penicillium expansum]
MPETEPTRSLGPVSKEAENYVVESEDVFDSSVFDPVLARKLSLINTAIDKIGMTPFQWKLFFLNGFGYTVDSLLVICQSIAMPAVTMQYGSPDKRLKGIALASQIGLLAGAAIWGLSADIIGRRLAFNSSLLLAAVFTIIAGGMPGYISFATMVSLYSAAVGGNYILDSVTLLEFLPANKSWLVTFMSIWWAVGYTITGLLAWAFMSNYSCSSAAACAYQDNMGWRYLHFTIGGVTLLLSLLRVLLIRIVQTPRWLVSQNRDEEIILFLTNLSIKYDRQFDLTLEDLRSEGDVKNTEQSVWSTVRIKAHFSGLFRTKQLTWSFLVIMLNWFVIGVVSPLYHVFLPYYLKSQGAKVSSSSNYLVWRNYAINQVVGLVGPVIAGVLVETKLFGRRGTMALGALLTMVLQFAYTQIKTPAQNVGVSAAISAATNIYYGTMYAYTPEILPSAHRATGYAICVVFNRIGGIVGVIVGSYANVETTTPLFVCAALFALLIILSVLLPFESRGKRTQ